VKKLVAVLLVLLAVQSYGIYGGAQAKRIMYSCTMELGPLCYAWELNTVGRLLVEDKAAALESKMLDAKKKLDEDFFESFARKEKAKSDVQDVVRDIGEKAKEGIDKLIEGLGE
jgi:hypothetical protein